MWALASRPRMSSSARTRSGPVISGSPVAAVSSGVSPRSRVSWVDWSPAGTTGAAPWDDAAARARTSWCPVPADLLSEEAPAAAAASAPPGRGGVGPAGGGGQPTTRAGHRPGPPVELDDVQQQVTTGDPPPPPEPRR